MLNKLLKYDLKFLGKSLFPFYGLLILLSLVTKLSSLVVKSMPMFKTINIMSNIILVLLLIGTLFFTFIIQIKRFYQNILKDEGYLTNTLPVKKSNIILSKLLSSFIFFILSIVVMVLSILIAYYNKSAIDSIVNYINQLILATGYSKITIYVYAIVLILFTYIHYLTTVYLSLLLGHMQNEHKILYSFVFGIVIYVALQILSSIGLVLLGIFNPNLITEMNGTNVSISSLSSVFILSLILTIIAPIVCYYLSCVVMNKKLNLE